MWYVISEKLGVSERCYGTLEAAQDAARRAWKKDRERVGMCRFEQDQQGWVSEFDTKLAVSTIHLFHYVAGWSSAFETFAEALSSAGRDSGVAVVGCPEIDAPPVQCQYVLDSKVQCPAESVGWAAVPAFAPDIEGELCEAHIEYHLRMLVGKEV